MHASLKYNTYGPGSLGFDQIMQVGPGMYNTVVLCNTRFMLNQFSKLDIVIANYVSIP